VAAVNSRDAFDPEVGFKVAKKRCDECLYSKNKVVPDERRVEILEGCRKTNTYFLCHKATIARHGVVCRGFYDEQTNTACRLAGMWNLTVFVDPESPPKAKKKRRRRKSP
jgi:hypothetical protein